jgi:hypothetical protein
LISTSWFQSRGAGRKTGGSEDVIEYGKEEAGQQEARAGPTIGMFVRLLDELPMGCHTGEDQIQIAKRGTWVK